MKKRLLKNLGILSVVSTPLSAIVSCGSSYSPDEEAVKQRDKLSASLPKLVQNEWLEKVVGQYYGVAFEKFDKVRPDVTDVNFREIFRDQLITKALWGNQDIQKVARFLLKEKGMTYASTSGGNFLVDYAKDLLQTNNYSFNKTSNTNDFDYELSGVEDDIYKNPVTFKQTELAAWSMYESLDYTGDAPNANGWDENMIKTIIRYNIKNFRDDLLKALVSTWYLRNTNKDEWTNVYRNASKDVPYQSLYSVDNKLDSDKFVLLKAMNDGKFFLKWTVALDANKSQDFIGIEDETASDLKNRILKTASQANRDITPKASYSTQHKLITDQYIPNITTNTLIPHDVIGFQGASNQSSLTEGVLTYDEEKMKDATSPEKWIGFVFDNKLVELSDATTKINAFPKESNQISINIVAGIMPIWENDKFVFPTTNGWIDEIYASLILHTKNSSIYSNAVTYFTNRDKNPIVVEITQPDAKKIIENSSAKDYMKK